MERTIIHDGKIAVETRGDGTVWVCLNYDRGGGTNTWYPTKCDYHPYGLQAVLHYWTERISRNYAERVIIAVIQKPQYTIWHAAMGVDPDTPIKDLKPI